MKTSQGVEVLLSSMRANPASFMAAQMILNAVILIHTNLLVE